MPEVVHGSYGPWYARIQLIDKEYCVLIFADEIKTFLVKDRPTYRIHDVKDEHIPWKFYELKDAIRFAKKELRRWKRLEKRKVKQHIREEEFTEMRIY